MSRTVLFRPSSSLRSILVLISLLDPIPAALALPGPVLGQRAFVGAMAGRNSTQLLDDRNLLGLSAGFFFQADLTDHFGIRSEATLVETGVDAVSMSSTVPPGGEFPVWDMKFVQINAMGRLSWENRSLPPLGSRVGVSVFGGGWLGARTQGRVELGEPRDYDFGHLVGVGFSWGLDPVLLQVDLRSSHGEVGFWKHGPTRKGSELLVSLGYRVH